MGCAVIFEYDVGVAGIHRHFPCMVGADALVVAAGREGTTPAEVAGLVEAPCDRPASLHRLWHWWRAGGFVLHAPVLFHPARGQYRCRLYGRGYAAKIARRKAINRK